MNKQHIILMQPAAILSPSFPKSFLLKQNQRSGKAEEGRPFHPAKLSDLTYRPKKKIVKDTHPLKSNKKFEEEKHMDNSKKMVYTDLTLKKNIIFLVLVIFSGKTSQKQV